MLLRYTLVKSTVLKPDRIGRSDQFNREPETNPVRLKPPKLVNNRSKTGKPIKNRG